MNWVYLIIAGIFEIGWPLGMKFSQVTSIAWMKHFWLAFAVLTMAASGYFLYLAQRNIPIGTAYAVWTGIGATGAFVAGIIFFRDEVNFWRVFFVFLIVVSIIGLRLTYVK